MKPLLVLWETHHLGDALLSLPFVREAKKHYAVRIVCRPDQAPVYRALGGGLEITAWEPFWSEGLSLARRCAGFFRLCGLIWDLRRAGIHDAVSCWADVRIHLFMTAGGARRRVGLPMAAENFYAVHLPWRRRKLEQAARVEKWAGRFFGEPLLSDPVFRGREACSHLEVWKKLGAAWGWELNCDTPWLEPKPLPEGPLLDFFREARKEKREIWMVHSGARHPARRWPPEFFREVVREVLEGRNCAVVFVETDDQLSWPELPEWQRAVRPGSLEEFMAAVAETDVVFCNDSFPAHLGAALGKSVWTIFSNQDPALFAPYRNETRVIAKNVCEFRPCLDRCLKPSFECLEAVGVRDAVEKMKNA